MTGHWRSSHYRTVNGRKVFVRAAFVLGVDANGIRCEGGSAFPTKCFDCGEAIYVLRAARGGTTRLTALGPPWPKHICETLGQGMCSANPNEMGDLFDNNPPG